MKQSLLVLMVVPCFIIVLTKSFRLLTKHREYCKRSENELGMELKNGVKNCVKDSKPPFAVFRLPSQLIKRMEN
jgi:hypothetical protein